MENLSYMLQTLLSRRKPKSWCVEEISLKRRDVFSKFLHYWVTAIVAMYISKSYPMAKDNFSFTEILGKIRFITDSTHRLSLSLLWYLILLSFNDREQRQNGIPYFFHSQDSKSVSRELLAGEREGISIFNHYEKSSEIKEERENGSRKFPSPTSVCGENNARSPTFILLLSW